MKIGTIVTASDLNKEYIDFIPTFIKSWNKILPKAQVKVVLIGETIPENLINYSNNIQLFTPIQGMKTAFQAQCIRLLYPRFIDGGDGVLISDMDMIPLNQKYYTEPIKNIDDNTFVSYRAFFNNGSENGNITKENPIDIPICYNVATPNIWKEIFGSEDNETVLKRWYNNTNYNGIHGGKGWGTDQKMLLDYFINYKGKKVLLKRDTLGFNRLTLNNLDNIDTSKISNDIKNGIYSDYHCPRPYEQNKEIIDFVLNSISNYQGGKRKLTRKKRSKKYKRKTYKKKKFKGGNLPNVYCFWTGTNEMSSARKNNLESLKNSGLNVVLVTPNNLNEYIKEPLHEGYQYLSEVHKADYLRTYFMHFYGGGYSDIKKTRESWIPTFNELQNDPNKWIAGYKELDYGVGNIKNNKNMSNLLKRNWEVLIGNGAYICKPNTPFTNEWYSNLVKKMDNKLDLLKQYPARSTREEYSNSYKYPFGFAELLREIFHPLCYKYKDHLINTLPPPDFSNYM